MNINKENLIKIIILSGFTFFFVSLIKSKEILHFIHPRLLLPIKFSIVLMIITCIVYFFTMGKTDRRPINYKSYIIFIIPLLIILIANIGGDFEGSEHEHNHEHNHSHPIVTEEGADILNKVEICEEGIIELNNDNYFNILQEISSNFEKYEGRKISLEGFVYKNEDFQNKEFVCGRYLMVCCASDMQIVGFLCKDNSNKVYNSDSWVKVTGTLKKNEDPSSSDSKYIEVESSENIKAPKEQYIYAR